MDRHRPSLQRRLYNRLRSLLGALLRDRPEWKQRIADGEAWVDALKHDVARLHPGLIRPRPYMMMIAVTGRCTSRCLGCRYERDFMVGEQLEWPVVRDLLDDAKEAGFYTIRLYGGEPLLHPDLPRMVAHCRALGLRPFVTTNGILLDAKRLDPLYEAGLRDISFGIYGLGRAYDDYVQRPGAFARIQRNLDDLRRRYGDALSLHMSWLLMRPTCTVEDLRGAWDFARRYDMSLGVDLVHYSLPYFSEGPDRMLQFRPEDRPAIEKVVLEMEALHREEPLRLRHSLQGLRSIPDWLILGPEMKVPCTAYDMIWVGADGTVQMCFTTFPLGNLHRQRLRELLHTDEHRRAARDAFQLNCPNCHCGANERVLRHSASRRRYGGAAA